jgi:hypothetical protein
MEDNSKKPDNLVKLMYPQHGFWRGKKDGFLHGAAEALVMRRSEAEGIISNHYPGAKIVEIPIFFPDNVSIAPAATTIPEMSTTPNIAEAQTKNVDFNAALRFLSEYSICKGWVERLRKEYTMDIPCAAAAAMTEYARLYHSQQTDAAGKTLARYDTEFYPGGHGEGPGAGMIQTKDGEYVMHSDASALLSAKEQEIARLQSDNTDLIMEVASMFTREQVEGMLMQFVDENLGIVNWKEAARQFITKHLKG